MFLLKDLPLLLDTPFEINGVQYPSNWLRLATAEEKRSIGVVEVPDPPPPPMLPMTEAIQLPDNTIAALIARVEKLEQALEAIQHHGI